MINERDFGFLNSAFGLEAGSYGSGGVEGDAAEVGDAKSPEGKAGCSGEFQGVFAGDVRT